MNLRLVSRHTLLVMIVMLGIPTLLKSGSVIPTQLAPLSCVNFSLPLGGLQYQPLPTLDLGEFRAQVEGDVHKILQSYDIEVTGNCQQTLRLNLDYDRDLRARGFTVFSLGLELKEPATLLRHSCAGSDPAVTSVTSWSFSTLFWTEDTSPLSALVGEIELIVVEFGQKVKQARHAKRSLPGETAAVPKTQQE